MANLKEQLARKLSTLDVPAIEQTTEEATIMAKDTDVIQLRPQTDNLPAALDAAPHFVVTFAEAKHRLQQLQQFVSEFMKPGIDYCIVPGTDKPTLLKPGAEKLCEIENWGSCRITAEDGLKARPDHAGLKSLVETAQARQRGL